MAILFIASCVYSQQWKTLIIDGKSANFKTLKIGVNEYLSLSTISNYFLPKSKLQPTKFSIKFNGNVIRYAPSSVFSAMLSERDSVVFQMRQPAIFYQNELLIPFNSFLLSLEIFQLYRVDMQTNEIKLTKYLTPIENNDLSAFKNKLSLLKESKEVKSKPLNSEKEETDEHIEKPYVEKIDKPKKDDKHKLTENEIANMSDKTPPPNSYKLPKDLNRGDLSEVSKKISINDKELFITNYYVEQANSSLTFVLSANNVIEQYQKPESADNKISIRIPNAKNGIANFKDLSPLIKDINDQIVDGILIYTLEFNKNPNDFNLRRNGPKELILTIYFNNNNS